MDKKTLAIKILVPALILAVIFGMYFLKKSQSEEDMIADVSHPLKITSVSLEEIKDYGIPTVIDFGSDSCIPCKEMAPVLETLNAEWQGKAAVQFMDVWKYTEGCAGLPCAGHSHTGIFHC